MFSKLAAVLRVQNARLSPGITLIFFVPAIFCAVALAQTGQTSDLSASGAPLLITPQAQLISSDGRSNAVSGNPVGTAGVPALTNDLSLALQFSGPASAVTITPADDGLRSVGTPEVHLGPPPQQIGARNATAGTTAGATNSTSTPPPPGTTTLAEYSVPGNIVTTFFPVQAAGMGTVISAVEPANGRLGERFDLGVGESGSLFATESLVDVSLGDVARESRSRRAWSNAAVITNEDGQLTTVQLEARADRAALGDDAAGTRPATSSAKQPQH